MSQSLQQTVALLTRTPLVLDTLLRDLPEAWTSQNEGGKTWSIPEVIGHLVHGERVNWLPRARMILRFDETPFEAFDRLGHINESAGKPLHQLLDEFISIRSQNLRELNSMDLHEEQLQLRGQHPAFGSVTLSQLLATWCVHDLTHLHQISRIMAHPYREAVGPWSAYLGVLKLPPQ
jgi:hypothetical protein